MVWCFCVFFFKQKTAYEMRISDWSSDVCSSDLPDQKRFPPHYGLRTYSVHEEAGLVRVALKGEIPFTGAASELLPLSGTVALTIDHAQYVRAFLDAPELVITVPGVELTKYLARDPQEQGGRLIMERSCRWREIGRAQVCTPVTNA